MSVIICTNAYHCQCSVTFFTVFIIENFIILFDCKSQSAVLYKTIPTIFKYESYFVVYSSQRKQHYNKETKESICDAFI